MVRQTQLQVIEVEVQTAEHDADGGVEGGARGDGGVVGRGDGAEEGGVRAADVADLFRVEFLLDAGFAEDEDGPRVWGEGEDPRDVDCGAVGGAEDFVLFGGGTGGSGFSAGLGWEIEGGGEGMQKGGRGVMAIPLLRGCPCCRVSSCSRRGTWCCCL